MDERVIFAGVKFWNNSLPEILVLHFRELELGHVLFLKSFRPEAHLLCHCMDETALAYECVGYAPRYDRTGGHNELT
jgi:hypothetical protein